MQPLAEPVPAHWCGGGLGLVERLAAGMPPALMTEEWGREWPACVTRDAAPIPALAGPRPRPHLDRVLAFALLTLLAFEGQWRT